MKHPGWYIFFSICIFIFVIVITTKYFNLTDSSGDFMRVRQNTSSIVISEDFHA